MHYPTVNDAEIAVQINYADDIQEPVASEKSSLSDLIKKLADFRGAFQKPNKLLKSKYRLLGGDVDRELPNSIVEEGEPGLE